MKKRHAILVTFVILGVLVAIVAFVGHRIYENLYGPRGLFGHVDASRRLLERLGLHTSLAHQTHAVAHVFQADVATP